MKKMLLSLLGLCVCMSMWADGDKATITSVPSPAVVDKPVTVTVTTSDFGTDVYVYTWAKVDNVEYRAANWGDTNVAAFKMSGQGGTYTFTISDIATFYKKVGSNQTLTTETLPATTLAKLDKLYFIAKTPGGKQTQDLEIAVAQGKYSGGDGINTSPWLISTTADLVSLSTTPADWSGAFKLTADVAATGMTSPIGNATTAFSGTFDGAGHVVTGVTISQEKAGEPAGLFGMVDGASIRDLGVRDAVVEGAAFAGILAGRVMSGTIERCYTTGSVTATSICCGALVGDNGGTISDCYSVATVKSSSYAAGGLVGKNSGMVSHAIASGTVEGYDYVGGLVGANYGTVASSVAVNDKVTSDTQTNYAARFGGNNNSRNTVTGSHAWNAIKAGHDEWTGYGDDATAQDAMILATESKFKELTGWDFENVWKWQTTSARAVATAGPVLRVHDQRQPMIFPQRFVDIVTGLSTVADGHLTVETNRGNGTVTVSGEVALGTCTVYSVGGTMVARADAKRAGSVTIDLGDCQAGAYILTVETESGTRNFKIIK